MANGVSRNQRVIALFEGLICVVRGEPGTVDLRTQGHVNGASICRDAVYRFRMNRHDSRIKNVGAV